MKPDQEFRNRGTFRSLVKELLPTPDLAGRVEGLFELPAAQEYLQRTGDRSAVRFEASWRRILGVLKATPYPASMAPLMEVLTEPAYQESLKLYYRPPLDNGLLELFEEGVFQTATQSVDLGRLFLQVSDQYALADLRKTYEADHPRFARLAQAALVRFLQRKRRADETVGFAELLGSAAVQYLAAQLEADPFDADRLDAAVNNLIDGAFRRDHRARARLEAHLQAVKRHLLVPIPAQAARSAAAGRAVRLLTGLGPGEDEAFPAFAKGYPYEPKKPSAALWDFLFQSPPERAGRALKFFTSPGFISFYRYYALRSGDGILEFLLKNIFFCLEDAKLEEFPGSLMPVILTLMLQQKVEPAFLTRRSEFSRWLKENCRSELVEAQFTRFFFYEYIFIHQKKIETRGGLSLTQFADARHRRFCELLDEAGDRRLTPTRKESLYRQILELGRDALWEGVAETFPGQAGLVAAVRSLAVAEEVEDLAVPEVLQVLPEHLEFYVGGLEPLWAVDFGPGPEGPGPWWSHRYWCRLTFEQARPFLFQLALPLLGTFPLLPDTETNWAKTDGQRIWLPMWADFFPDPPVAVPSNRNLALFAGLTLHEAGHIIGGTFHFDLRPLVYTLSSPALFHHIHNCFEDFRIEAYLVQIRAHHQAADLLRSLNLYLFTTDTTDTLALFNLSIFCQAAGLWDEITALNPRHQAALTALWESTLSSGRFARPKALWEYGVERLKHLDPADPFAVFSLAWEFYHIQKDWPDLRLVTEKAPAGQGIPIESQEELDRLRALYGADPEGFYLDHSLPVFPGTFGTAAPRTEAQPLVLQQEGIPPVPEGQGVFAEARRTWEDDALAREQMDRGRDPFAGFRTLLGGKPPKKAPPPGQIKKRRIKGLDPQSGRRTQVRNCCEYTVSDLNPGFLTENRRFDPVSAQVARALQDLLENHSTQQTEFSPIEGDVDLERLVELFADPHNASDAAFLETQEENRKSLKVVIGLDISGSTRYPIDGSLPDDEYQGPPRVSPARIIDIEKHFALIFAKALQRLTDQIDVYAFSSVTSTNVYRAEPLEALSSFSPEGANRDGDFIRYVNSVFDGSDAEVKYFFLITDGRPSSTDYEGQFALDDTLLALRECRRSRLKVVYINVDRQLEPYFHDLQAEVVWARHFVHPEEVIDVIPELVRSIAREVV